ncbi:hypothetical protein BJF90_07865 [Pseudonocardia sp. CNS-004]|nr:hypothetical protein BJF90_07865 [Pseudonocardia sp. CNS-004]
MTLNLHELVRLGRISESLRRSDPDLARMLSSPGRGRRWTGWDAASVGVPAVCVVLAVIGLVVGDTATSAVGGGVAMALCPFVLVIASKRRRS